MKKRTYMVPSEVGYDYQKPPAYCRAFVGQAADDIQVGRRSTGEYAERLEKWAPWNMFVQIRDENRFVYRRRGDRDEGAVARAAVVEDEVSASVKKHESECVDGGNSLSLLEAVESEILKRNQARSSAYVTSLKDLSRS